MNYHVKYIVAVAVGIAVIKAVYYFPAEDLAIFAAGWFLFLQVAFILYMGAGLCKYVVGRRHRTL